MKKNHLPTHPFSFSPTHMAPPISQGGYLIFDAVQNGYFMIFFGTSIASIFSWHFSTMVPTPSALTTRWFDEFFSMLHLDSSWAPGCLGDVLGMKNYPVTGRDYNKPWSLGIRGFVELIQVASLIWGSILGTLGVEKVEVLNTSKGWLFVPFAWNCL